MNKDPAYLPEMGPLLDPGGALQRLIPDPAPQTGAGAHYRPEGIPVEQRDLFAWRLEDVSFWGPHGADRTPSSRHPA